MLVQWRQYKIIFGDERRSGQSPRARRPLQFGDPEVFEILREIGLHFGAFLASFV